MKLVAKVLGAAALCTALSATIFAQWPDYRVLPTPTLPDGKPDLKAPTPRMADGKPDFSGTWRGVYPTPPGRRGGAPLPPPEPARRPRRTSATSRRHFPAGCR